MTKRKKRPTRKQRQAKRRWNIPDELMPLGRRVKPSAACEAWVMAQPPSTFAKGGK